MIVENLVHHIDFVQRTCLDTRQPGSAFKKLDTRQSEILTKSSV